MIRPILMAVATLFSMAAPAGIFAAPVDKTAKLDTPIGSLIPRLNDRQKVDNVDAQYVLRDFAQCTVNNKKTAVTRLLASLPESNEEASAMPVITGQESWCLTGASKMNLSPSLFRGTMAEFLYKKLVPPASSYAKKPAKLDYSVFMNKLALADKNGVDEADVGIHAAWWMSYCSVHEAPGPVDNLLRTKLNSEEEAAAFRVLQPIMEACLTQGQKIDFDKLNLRGFLAQAMYRQSANIDEDF